MARQLLIYEQITPISSERHRDWSVKTGNDFGFARHVNSVPLAAVEFPAAATDFPIVFAEAGDSVVPVALMGVRAEQNLYVDADGRWTARYVPAFLRRYPFVFSATSAGGERFVLCIDESFEGCNQQGLGERLFDASGERTQYLGNVLSFQQEYRAQTLRTQQFCARLKQLELLEPMTARAQTANGAPIGLTGFLGVQRAKLHALPGEKLAELSQTGELELAYVHLQSLANFRPMIERAGSAGAGTNGQQPAPVTKKAASKRKASSKPS